MHRVGTLEPGDNIVLVVTASEHRDAAFDAASFLMDYLKTSRAVVEARDGSGRRALGRGQGRSDDAATSRWTESAPPSSQRMMRAPRGSTLT